MRSAFYRVRYIDMSNAHWIWYNGDYELYHSLKLHTRRHEYGVELPGIWNFSTPYPNVLFIKDFSCPEEFTFKMITTKKAVSRVSVDGRAYNAGENITVPAGNHTAVVEIMCPEGLPCFFIDSKYLVTDDTWAANHRAGDLVKVGDKPFYGTADSDPETFAFEYLTLKPKWRRKVTDGMLYDYGKETFCRITVTGADPSETIILYFGESEEEALDREFTEGVITLKGEKKYVVAPRAMRYLFVKSAKDVKIKAEYEFLPIEDKASFACDKKEIGKIWDVCSYTFHLNSREFYLDGIKRDRWVWSGDAYQSYMANRYLYFDNEITKRTIIALLGKPPYETHVNTINDYTMYLIIGAYEYYLATGDEEFIKIYFGRLKSLYDFLNGRADGNGYICQRPGDWIFIDWSDMDKSGPMAAEQILFWRTKQAMAALSEICGLDGASYDKEAAVLKKKIERDFWNREKKAFVDCLGSAHVTRHPNIFAIMYDFVSESKGKMILKSVLNNDSITQITTPYFEFFELCVRCKLGDVKFAQDKISSYWGGMLKLGATSIWEQYVPDAKGIEHYGMYGRKFGCSLCHAWGSGPIYLLGRYCLGVYPTSVGYKTFTVKPNRGRYKFINGTVPLPNGESVEVYADSKEIRVKATVAGGTVVAFGKEYEIPAGEEIVVKA